MATIKGGGDKAPKGPRKKPHAKPENRAPHARGLEHQAEGDETLRVAGEPQGLPPPSDPAVPRCAATKKSDGEPCTKPAGWRTDHPGSGRCYLHGGRTPIAHGRYSSVKRWRINELQEQLAEDPDPLNLTPELALLRALVIDYIERHAQLTDALIDWHKSWKEDGKGAGKPPKVPDILAVGNFIRDIGGLVEKVQKIQQQGTITLETLDRVLEQLGVEVVSAAQEAIPDEAQRSTLLAAVERRWGTIRVSSKPGT